MNNSVDFELEIKKPSVRVFEVTNDCCSRRTVVEFFSDDDYYVHECNECKWKVCCNCMLFMKCDKKGRNRVGLIPNLIDDCKKFKIKFLMELKNHYDKQNR